MTASRYSMDPARIEQLVADYLAGDPVRVVAARYGRSMTWVRETLERLGVPRRPGGGVPEPIATEEIIRLRDEECLSWAEIVGGVTVPLERPESLVLGRFYRSNGQLHIVGRSTELHPTAAEQIATAITPAGNEHPWPAQLPPSWHDRAARDYHRVVPNLVVEVRVDVATAYAIDGPSHWRHRLRLLRLRTDLNIRDVPRDLNIERPD